MSSLPVLNTPTYFLTIPSTKKKIKYRPFLQREKKILLIAMQEDDPEVVLEAIKTITKNCLFGQVEPESLTMFDIEYIFLCLYIKSKHNIVDLNFTCENPVEKVLDGEKYMLPCGCINQVKVNLEDVKTNFDVNHSNKIMLSDTIGMIMKYPKFDVMSKLELKTIEDYYDIIYEYVESVFDGQEIIETFTKDDVAEFVENMNDEQFAKIEQFFSTLPKLRTTIHIKCGKCGYSEDVLVEGLQSFLV